MAAKATQELINHQRKIFIMKMKQSVPKLEVPFYMDKEKSGCYWTNLERGAVICALSTVVAGVKTHLLSRRLSLKLENMEQIKKKQHEENIKKKGYPRSVVLGFYATICTGMWINSGKDDDSVGSYYGLRQRAIRVVSKFGQQKMLGLMVSLPRWHPAGTRA